MISFEVLQALRVDIDSARARLDRCAEQVDTPDHKLVAVADLLEAASELLERLKL